MGDHASYAPRSPDLSGMRIPMQNHNDMWGSPSQSYPLKNPKREPSNFMSTPEAYPGHMQPVQSSWFGPPQMSTHQNPQMHNPYGHQQQHQQQQYHQNHLQQHPHHSAHAPNLKAEVKQEPEVYKPYPGELEGTVIKTKFPVARIKRIVQADEDVGKVAQVTPVVVSKALELFMTSLALNAANIAKSRGSKRVTGAHLKLAVAQDDQFDFLQEIVDKIPDPPPASASTNRGGAEDGDKKPRAKARKKKEGSEDDDDDDDDMAYGEDEQHAKQKRKPRSSRKKKADDSD